MNITVGSKWVAKDRKGSIQATVQQADGAMIHYLYDGGSGITYSLPVSCFLEFFEPVEQRDTKEDITVGSRWKNKASGVTTEVISILDGKKGVQYKDGCFITTSSFYNFLKCYEFISVGSPMEFDNVNNPQHYTNGQVECIDAIRAALTDEEFRGFCKGNVLKYTWREKHKGGNESLEKAVWYLKQMVGE